MLKFSSNFLVIQIFRLFHSFYVTADSNFCWLMSITVVINLAYWMIDITQLSRRLFLVSNDIFSFLIRCVTFGRRVSVFQWVFGFRYHKKMPSLLLHERYFNSKPAYCVLLFLTYWHTIHQSFFLQWNLLHIYNP